MRSSDLRRRYFLRGTKRDAHKVFRNAVLCWGSLKKRLCRGIVFQVGIQEVQCVEGNPGMTRVGVIPSVIGYLILRKALRALPASKHRTELWVCHAQHIHGEEIAVYPGVQNVWTHYVCCGTIIIFVTIFKKVRIFCSEEKKRYGHPLWIDIARHLHEARVIAHAAVHGGQGTDAGVSC